MRCIAKAARGPAKTKLATLLLADTHGTTAATSRLGVLATHAQAPGVAQTTMHADLLHALQVLAELVVQAVGKQLRVRAVDDVLLTIQEPLGNAVLQRVLHDRDNTLKLVGGQLTGTLRRVDASLAADDAAEAAANTLDGGEGIDDLASTLDVRVQDTQNVLETSLVGNVDRALHTKEGGDDEKSVQKEGGTGGDRWNRTMETSTYHSRRRLLIIWTRPRSIGTNMMVLRQMRRAVCVENNITFWLPLSVARQQRPRLDQLITALILSLPHHFLIF